MNGIHVNSTAPFFARHPDSEYSVEDFGLYCEVISALQWRKMNGDIFMVADSRAAEYYRKIGIDKVWNGITELIPDELDGIDPEMFWAAGKLFALRDIPENAALVDEDLIVWKTLELSDNAVTCAHREYISEGIYPDPKVFGVSCSGLLDRLDKTALPCNTAFLYIPDSSFRLFYANQSIAFMKECSANRNDDRLCRMVFAEQRLLGMLCALTGTPVETLMDMNRLFIAQDDYTHLWGAKQAMRDDPEKRKGFLERCRRRIRNDFPEFEYVIGAIDEYTKKKGSQ
ncbi:MAG: hypothetical protein J6N15_09160 [Ruminiclostridium sp.]|nr:hypothetical protein [Ruminiclostridium sp.]